MYGNNYVNPYGGTPYYMPNNNAMPDMLTQQKMAYQPNMAMPTQNNIPNMNNQPIQSTPMTNIPPKQGNDTIWVLSQTEAESYPVALNNTVTMWDKNADTIYIKSVDGSGKPSFRVLDFVERIDNTSTNTQNRDFNLGKDFVHLDDFKALESKYDTLIRKYDTLKEKIDGLSIKPTTKNNTKSEGK